MNVNEEHVQSFTKDWKKYDLLGEKVGHLIGEVLNLRGLKTHAISYRAKEIDSFRKKIAKKKYPDPLKDVTDLCGVRIIAYVEDDVLKICEQLRDLFDVDEDRSINKNVELGADRVGYKSIHLICKLKRDRLNLPEYSAFSNAVFEVQVRTILQHSWAEIEHDKNYKYSGVLPDNIRRRLMLLSGALEILDREFNSVSKEIDQYAEDVKGQAIKGDLDITIDSVSLSEFLALKFKDLFDRGLIREPYSIGSDILYELNNFGLFTLADFDNIIPEDFIGVVLLYPNFEHTVISILRDLMLIHDFERYVRDCYDSRWIYYDDGNPLTKHYNFDMSRFDQFEP